MGKSMKNIKVVDGFTLIELMVTVAILAIIVGVAVPNYTESVKRSRRVDARNLLLENVHFMERVFTENNRYNTNLGVATVLPNLTSPRQGTTQYNISIRAMDATSYTLQAVPAGGGGMVGDKCGTYLINQTNQQLNDGNTETSAVCWSR
jgi:type IV pilus assembly protein PilE